MNVRNCRKCGRLFNYMSGPSWCPACREQMEEKFQVVKEYIRANTGVGIQQVSEACDVETAQIRQWLREERLELTEGSPLMMGCESCGALIRCGRYCEKCKGNLTNAFQSVLQERTPVGMQDAGKRPRDNRMRYLNDDK